MDLLRMYTKLSVLDIVPPSIITTAGGPTTLDGLVNNVFTFLLYMVGVIGITMITYSGFMYIISVGNPSKTKLALNSIIYTFIGFAIAILGRSVVGLVLSSSGLSVCSTPTSSTTSAALAASCPTVQSTISSGLAFFLWIIGITSVIIMIVAGMLYVFSAGDPGKTKTAKDTIMYAAIGLVVTLIGAGGIALVNTLLK
ncbi:MAG: hypothetical protein WCI47_03215 [bacterium]